MKQADLRSRRNSRLALPVFVLVGLAIGLGTYFWAHKDDAHLEETRRMGEALVLALEAYRADRGEYPESLADLQPTYLARVEPPTWGTGEWIYRRYAVPEIGAAAAATTDGRGLTDVAYLFTLSVPANERRYPVLYYDLADRRWVLNN